MEVHFIMYWGIGNRPNIGKPEIDAMSFLFDNLNRLSGELGLQYDITFVLTDTHATINGINRHIASSYCDSVCKEFDGQGRYFEKLSSIVCDDGASCATSLCEEYITQLDPLSCLPESTKEVIIDNARRCAIDKDPVQAAREYIALSLIESPVVRNKYSTSIQITYQPPSMMWILPALPTIHMYVGAGHEKKRPWFKDLSIEGG